MDVFSAIVDVRRQRWAGPQRSWGLVPTMGFLHEGHLSLVRRARQENDRVGASVFVNPAQFDNPQDLATYPRDTERDLALLEEEGVDLVWMPGREVVYPAGYQTFVEVQGVARPLEGAARPGFFRGVATVVAKLFNVFEPQRTYFGQKDAQQAVVIRQMVQDLNYNLEVILCPTVREADGLAMSSRNNNLSVPARRQATCVYQALLAAKGLFEEGERGAEKLRTAMAEVVQSAAIARLDYVSVAHCDTLEELAVIEARALVSLAVFFDAVRLIDSMTLGA